MKNRMNRYCPAAVLCWLLIAAGAQGVAAQESCTADLQDEIESCFDDSLQGCKSLTPQCSGTSISVEALRTAISARCVCRGRVKPYRRCVRRLTRSLKRYGLITAQQIDLLEADIAACGSSSNKQPPTAAPLPADMPEPVRYSAENPFLSRIDEAPAIDPNSSAMVARLAQSGANGRFLISQRKWTVPVFLADEATPRFDVPLTAKWAPRRVLYNVPIPSFAAPDPAGDGHLVVIDRSSGCEYDFWKARRSSSGWSAAWGNAISTNSNGIFPAGLSARGSGFALLNGVIWPQELRAGAIDHALLFSFDFVKAGGPVSPASESDGEVGSAGAIPEGARLQLDPDLDLNSLSLNPFERTIAEALQRYGMILGDSGGGVQLYAVSPNSVSGEPYEGILPAQDYVYLENIPLERFRVLELPSQQPETPVEIQPTGCNQYEK